MKYIVKIDKGGGYMTRSYSPDEDHIKSICDTLDKSKSFKIYDEVGYLIFHNNPK